MSWASELGRVVRGAAAAGSPGGGSGPSAPGPGVELGSRARSAGGRYEVVEPGSYESVTRERVDQVAVAVGRMEMKINLIFAGVLSAVIADIYRAVHG